MMESTQKMKSDYIAALQDELEAAQERIQLAYGDEVEARQRGSHAKQDQADIANELEVLTGKRPKTI